MIRIFPNVNFNQCEADGRCVQVCPNDVFEMQPILDEDRLKLSFIGKLKTRVHGNQKAYVVNPSECIGCGKCVKICPEHAIKLIEN